MKALVVMLGVAASGKTMFASELSKMVAKFHRISSGDIVRLIHEGLSDDEKNADQEFINKHGLSKYNDQIEEELYRRMAVQVDAGHTPVLDGYPRTADQMAKLLSKDYMLTLVKVNVSTMVAMHRLQTRARDDYMDYESVLRAQTKQMSMMMQYVEDWSMDSQGYSIPILDLINNSDGEEEKGRILKHGVECIKSFHLYNIEAYFRHL